MSDNGTNTRYDSVSTGTLVDGLWDGQVNRSITDHSIGEVFDLSFSAVKGKPTEDKTEEFLARIPWNVNLEEGTYTFAFDYHPDIRYYWHFWLKGEERVGITGFIE